MEMRIDYDIEYHLNLPIAQLPPYATETGTPWVTVKHSTFEKDFPEAGQDPSFTYSNRTALFYGPKCQWKDLHLIKKE